MLRGGERASDRPLGAPARRAVGAVVASRSRSRSWSGCSCAAATRTTLPTRRRPARLPAGGDDRGQAARALGRARPPDLLGRRSAGPHLRADAHLGQPDLHPLPAEGRAGRDPPGGVHDRRHLPGGQRVQGAEGAREEARRERVLRAGRRFRRLQHRAAEQRLPGLPRLERADRGLRPVAAAGARDSITSGQVAPVS